MARKRKKSRAKRRSKTEAPEASSESAALEPSAETPNPPSSEDEEPVIDLDADLDDVDDGLTDLLAETVALGENVAVGEAVAEPIDDEDNTPDEEVEEIVVEDLDAILDDEDSDAESRERLIAEALAFVEREETGEAGEPSAEAGAAPGVGDDEPGGEASDAPDDALSGEVGTTATEAAPAGPPMSPAAIAALEAIQRGFIAGDLDEEVLDLGDVSDPDERDRLLAAAMAHAEMQEARYRVQAERSTSTRWKGTLASLIFIVSLLLLAQPPAFVVPDPPATLSAEDHLYGIRVTLLIQAQQIEAFRTRQERLPNSLAEVDVRLAGVRFVRSSSRLYQLTAYTAEGEVVVYDSGTPDPAFAAVQSEWVTTRDPS